MNLIDLLIIIFLLFGLLKGLRKGLLNSLVGLCGTVIGLFVALNTYSYVVGWLDVRFQLTDKIAQYFEKRLVLSETVSQLKVGTLPYTEVNPSWDMLQLPEMLKLQLQSFSRNIGEQIGQTADFCLGDILYLFLAGIVLKILAIIFIWVLVDKGLSLISHLITRLTEDTFLGSLNKLGGLCIGILIRGLVLTVIIGLISPFFNIAQHTEPSFLSAVLKTTGEAFLVPWFTLAFSVLTGKLFSFWL
ncbi:MAG: CvpA family protein [Peptococcia bacterium]|jgi:uncharacterized membrane protein required for colicin V production